MPSAPASNEILISSPRGWDGASSKAAAVIGTQFAARSPPIVGQLRRRRCRALFGITVANSTTLGFGQCEAVVAVHAAVEGAVKSVIRYNESSPPASRFAGMHYDIEPYLLSGFSGEDRPGIIDGYLTVLGRIAALPAPAGLRFEVAIPFWFDSVQMHRSSHEVEGSLSYRVLSEAVIDLVDSVAIMDRRTRVDGSNGAVALTASELEYASETGKHVCIGLETGFLASEEELRFEGAGEPGLPGGESSRPWIVVGNASGSARMYVVPSSRLVAMPLRLRRDGVESTGVRIGEPCSGCVSIPAALPSTTSASSGCDRPSMSQLSRCVPIPHSRALRSTTIVPIGACSTVRSTSATGPRGKVRINAEGSPIR